MGTFRKDSVFLLLFSCEMVVACEQKRVGDDHLELEFQAVVNFLMRGLGTIGSSAGAVYALNC